MRGSRRALAAALLCAASVAAIRDTSLSESLFAEDTDPEDVRRGGVDAGIVEAAARVPKGIMSGEGWLCQDIEDVEKATQPQVRGFIGGFRLLDEYELLKEALRQAPKGRFRNWKASALDRALFLEGERPDSFRARGLEMGLTKAWGFWRSQFKICFWTADARSRLETSGIDQHLYADGREVQISCRGEIKVMDSGVAGQGLYHGKRSQPEEMTNEVFKLLYKRDALALHEEYGARILSRPRHSVFSSWHVNQAYWDILATRASERRFATKGVGIVFNQRGESCQQQFDGPVSSDSNSVTYSWLEYADYNITGERYLPSTSVFRPSYHYVFQSAIATAVTLWAMCHRNPAVGELAVEADLKSTIRTSGCEQVVGATWCKCPDWQQVRCGEHFVGEQSFDIDFLMAHRPEECKVGKMYCGRRGCKGV